MTDSEPDPTEHGPAESARPTLDRRDQPDAIQPEAGDRPHRTLPPDEEDADGSDAPGGR
jgi:hypothetical protein